MTSSNLIRLSGLAAVMAATLLLVLEIVDHAQGGTGLVAGFLWTDTFVAPELAASAPRFLAEGPPPGRSPSFLVFGVGWALFGLASLVGRVYPSSAAVLLIIGAAIVTVLSLAFLPVPFGGLPFEAALAWLGVALLLGSAPPCLFRPSKRSFPKGPVLRETNAHIDDRAPSPALAGSILSRPHVAAGEEPARTS